MVIEGTLAVAVPALLLVVSATLELAFRSTTRLELRRWAQVAFGDAEGEGPAGHWLEISFISVRLTRQISLICLIVAVTWVATSRWASLGYAGMLGATVLTYLLFDKLFPLALVSVVGPQRLLAVGRPSVALFRFALMAPARFFFRLQSTHRSRDSDLRQETEDGDLDAIIDLAEEEGLVSKTDEALLRGVADFGEHVVHEVMTPRVDMITSPWSARIEDLGALVAEHKLSRIPVVDGDLDQIKGIVHIKDLVTALTEGATKRPIAEICKPALFVPETKRIRDLLQEFQRRHAHMAIVVDEYGGTAGLVTLEDLVEEIVGDIQDEYEDEEETVVEEEDGALIAAGKAPVEEIERLLEVEIEDEEFETVGGMAFSHLGYVPRSGEEFTCQGLHVEVLDADDRRVQRVRIRRR